MLHCRDAVAAAALGGVEPGIGSIEQDHGIIAGFRNHAGGAEAGGDDGVVTAAGMDQAHALDGQAHAIRDGEYGLHLGAGKNDDKLLPAIARKEIAVAGLAARRGGDRPQAVITATMAVIIVEQFKMVDINHDQADMILLFFGNPPCFRQHLVETAAVGNAGEAVRMHLQQQAAVAVGKLGAVDTVGGLRRSRVSSCRFNNTAPAPMAASMRMSDGSSPCGMLGAKISDAINTATEITALKNTSGGVSLAIRPVPIRISGIERTSDMLVVLPAGVMTASTALITVAKTASVTRAGP